MNPNRDIAYGILGGLARRYDLQYTTALHNHDKLMQHCRQHNEEPPHDYWIMLRQSWRARQMVAYLIADAKAGVFDDTDERTE